MGFAAVDVLIPRNVEPSWGRLSGFCSECQQHKPLNHFEDDEYLHILALEEARRPLAERVEM
jgi:hypothetical protein